MAIPTPVNGMITDTVSQSSVMNLGSGPALAVSNLSQATAHAMALAAHNATFAQQQMQILAQAATAQAVAFIYSAASGSAKTQLGAAQNG